MNYETRICLFADILGFTRLVEQTTAGGQAGRQAMRKLELAIDRIAKATPPISEVAAINASTYGAPFDRQCTHFSDSFVISYRWSEFRNRQAPEQPLSGNPLFSIVLAVHSIARELALSGVFIRGGLTEGELVHRGMVVVGPAMVEAHCLESRQANYPRIVISPTLGRRLTSPWVQDEIQESARRVCQVDDAGVHYIDYFNPLRWYIPASHSPNRFLGDIEAVLGHVEAALEENADEPRVIAKYQWVLLRLEEATLDALKQHRPNADDSAWQARLLRRIQGLQASP